GEYDIPARPAVADGDPRSRGGSPCGPVGSRGGGIGDPAGRVPRGRGRDVARVPAGAAPGRRPCGGRALSVRQVRGWRGSGVGERHERRISPLQHGAVRSYTADATMSGRGRRLYPWSAPRIIERFARVLATREPAHQAATRSTLPPDRTPPGHPPGTSAH